MAEEEESISPHDVDYSVIRTSIDMGHSMIDQILNGIHYGSIEIQNYLYEECDFIMECKVCRNLFRSFPNFVAHKRVYCVEKHKEKLERERSMNLQLEEEVVVVQPESSTNQNSTSSQNNNDSLLQKVIENKFSGKSREYQFYTQVAETMEQKKAGKITSSVLMTAIPTNPNAMVVTHADGDQSERFSAQLVSQQKIISTLSPAKTSAEPSSQLKNTSVLSTMLTSNAQKNNNRQASQPKSIGDICKKLVAQQGEDIPRMAVTTQTRKSRKGVPQKSTEESVAFIPKPDISSNKSATDKSSASNKLKEKIPTENSSENNRKPEEWRKQGSKSSQTMSDDGKSVVPTDFPSSDIVSKTVTETNKDLNELIVAQTKSCRKCSRSFESFDKLKIHLSVKHGIKVGEFACPKCHRYYSSWKNVMRHLRIGHKATTGFLRSYRQNVAQENIQMKFSLKIKDPDDTVNTHSELFKALTGNIDSVVLLKETVVAGDLTKRTHSQCDKQPVNFKWSQKQITIPPEQAKQTQNQPKLSESSENDKSFSRTLKRLGANTVSNDENWQSEKPLTRTQKHAQGEPVMAKSMAKFVSRLDNEKTDMSDSEPMETEQSEDLSINSAVVDINVERVSSKKNTRRLNKETPVAKEIVLDKSEDENDDKQVSSKKNTRRLTKEKLAAEEVEQDEPITSATGKKVNRDKSTSSKESEPVSPATGKKVDIDDLSTLKKSGSISPATGKKVYKDDQASLKKSDSVSLATGKIIEKEELSSLKKYPIRLSLDNQKSVPMESEQSKSIVDKNQTVSTDKSVITVPNMNQTDLTEVRHSQEIDKNEDKNSQGIKSKSASVDSEKVEKIARTTERPSRSFVKPVKDTKSLNVLSSSNDSVEKANNDTEKGRNKSMDRKSVTKSSTTKQTAVSTASRTATMGSPGRTIAPYSPPHSPTLSINSNSGDSYSSKFKMSVKEMAELIENASLTKFANDRRKRARKILTDKESKNMGAVPKSLVKPMKKRVASHRLPIKRTYSTRLSADKLEDRFLTRTGRYVSKRLQREMKRLANSAGLVESNIYSSSAPAITTKDTESSSEKPSKDKHTNIIPRNTQTKKVSSEKLDNLKEGLVVKATTTLKSVTKSSDKKDLDSATTLKSGTNIIKSSDENDSDNETTLKSVTDITKSADKKDTDNNQNRTTTYTTVCGSPNLDIDKARSDSHYHQTRLSTGSRNSSRDRNEESSQAAKTGTKYSTSNKSGDTLDSMNTSTERGRTSSNERGRTSSNERSRTSSSERGRTSSNEQGRTSSNEPGRISSNERGRTSSKKRGKTPTMRSRTSSNEGRKLLSIERITLQPSGEVKNKKQPLIKYVVGLDTRQPELIIRDIKSPQTIADRVRAAANAEALEELFKKKTQAALKSVTNCTKSAERKNLDSATTAKSVTDITKSAERKDSDSPIPLKYVKNLTKSGERKDSDSPTTAKSVIDITKSADKKDTDNNQNKTITYTSVCDSPNLYIDEAKSDSHNHRTRLSTGSIYFNSELLKLSPSKASTAEGKLIRPSNVDPMPVTSLKRKLSLSPKRDAQVFKSNAQKFFPLSTGVKRCGCGKVFWKLKTYAKHKCPQKTPVISPKKIVRQENNTDASPPDLQFKRARIENYKIDNIKKESLSNIQGEKQNEFTNKVRNEKTMSTPTKLKELTKKNDNQHSPIFKMSAAQSSELIVKQHSPIFQKPVHSPKRNEQGLENLEMVNQSCGITPSVANDSDNESDFSGFSESDIHERIEELDDKDLAKGKDLVSDDVDGLVASGVDDEESDKKINSEPEDEGITYKSIRKTKYKRGSLEEILVEKSSPKTTTSEEKVAKFRHYVRDPFKPSKIHCQRNEQIEKLIDEKEKKCLKCNMEYTSMSNLRRHVIRHLGWKRYQCFKCMFACYDKAECRLHYSRAHNDNLDKYTFSECYLDLKQEASLVRNMKRVITMRNRKELQKNSADNSYKKPRSSQVISKRIPIGTPSDTMSDSKEKNNPGTSETNCINID